MKNFYERIALSAVELSVLEALQQIGFKSAFQLAENLAGRYDTLTVMRTLHGLLQLDLLIRISIKGERYYNLNQRNLSKIKLILTRHQHPEELLAPTEA